MCRLRNSRCRRYSQFHPWRHRPDPNRLRLGSNTLRRGQRRSHTPRPATCVGRTTAVRSRAGSGESGDSGVLQIDPRFLLRASYAPCLVLFRITAADPGSHARSRGVGVGRREARHGAAGACVQIRPTELFALSPQPTTTKARHRRAPDSDSSSDGSRFCWGRPHGGRR
jgi:hypothetical protein